MAAASSSASSGGADKKEGAYVTTGDVIPVDVGFIRGHGTLMRGDRLVASVSGFVERVNKLVSVRPLSSRYTGEIGDVVIGRIVEVADKRWKVDLKARQHATLMLSSVTLPGGVQRRRTEADELQMRTLFTENDLISAEVQNVAHDGFIALHTRSAKYGKLEFGQFVAVPAALIKRSKQHFHTLSCGVDIILGLNGYVWLTANAEADAKERANERKATGPSADADTAAAAAAAAAPAAGEAPAISATIRDNISRVRNCIVALAKSFVPIFTATITDAYEQSERMQLTSKDILNAENIQPVTEPALKRVQATGGASAMAWDRT